MSDLAMGGYGAFVWPAYGLALGLVLGVWVLAERRCRRIQRALAAAEGSSPDGRGR